MKMNIAVACLVVGCFIFLLGASLFIYNDIKSALPEWKVVCGANGEFAYTDWNHNVSKEMFATYAEAEAAMKVEKKWSDDYDDRIRVQKKLNAQFKVCEE